MNLRKVFYLTKEKLKELKQEYDRLVKHERTTIMGHETPKILESEDINPEFISFQEDMESVRGRIDELKNILDHHEVIGNSKKGKAVLVDVGAKVTVEFGGKENHFMIVGTLEANPNEGRISNESPMGAALLGHKVGDEVVVKAQNNLKCKIKNISYEVA